MWSTRYLVSELTCRILFIFCSRRSLSIQLCLVNGAWSVGRPRCPPFWRDATWSRTQRLAVVHHPTSSCIRLKRRRSTVLLFQRNQNHRPTDTHTNSQEDQSSHKQTNKIATHSVRSYRYFSSSCSSSKISESRLQGVVLPREKKTHWIYHQDDKLTNEMQTTSKT